MANSKNVVALFDLDGTCVELWDMHIKVYEATMRELFGVAGTNFLKEGYVAGNPAEVTVRNVLSTWDTAKISLTIKLTTSSRP